MAALTATELQDAIVQVGNSDFNKWEGRLSRYGALQAALDGSNLILPRSQVEGLKKSDVQVTKIPVLNKYNANVLSARSCTIECNNRVSTFKTLSYVTKGFTICVSDAINAGNYISRADDFAWQMKQGLKAVFASLDLSAVATLETNRNLQLADSNIATITNATGDYEENLLSDIYYDMAALMALNDLDDDVISNVMNTEGLKNMLKYESQGENNAINLRGVLDGSLPSAGNFQHYLTNSITLGTNREVHYLFPKGAFGLFVWNPWDFKNRSITGDGKKYYTIQDPIFGITWGVMEQTLCADLSDQSTGATAVTQTKYSFTADFSFLTGYSSDTSSPIIKVIAKKTPVSS